MQLPKFLLLLILLPTICFSQKKEEWIKKPINQWPSIAMINEVMYKNGESYVHSSFKYAATGFLIDTGKDTLAVTAKHVLWIAKTKTMNSVDLQGHLKRWVMHPKGNLKDTVVINKLINTDSTERLNGPESTITQRDWIVFSTKYVSPNIQPLKPRYTEVKPNERVWYFGCPYKEQKCIKNEAQVLEIEGNRIVLSTKENFNVAGASGSPIVDKNGFLIGIMGGSAKAKSTGENALYGTTTHYLKKVLTNKKPYNTPLIPIGNVLKQEILKEGISSGIKKFNELKKDKSNYFIYDFSPETINVLADQFLKIEKPKLAISLFKLSLKELKLTGTYTKLGKSYAKIGNKNLAIKAYRNAIKLWPDNEDAKAGLKKLSQ